MTEKKTVAELGENALIERLVGLLGDSDAVAGPGEDDCAVIENHREGFYQLLKTDCVVEGVHFLPGTDPEKVGRKAINRCISDIAAMGGIPRHALITLAIDQERAVEEIEGWYRGMSDAEFPVEIVGGETSSLPNKGAMISVAMTGEVEKENCVFRKGARPGDLIAVTGRLGNSFASERHLDFVPRLPEARWMVSESKKCRPTSMMDLSDGLARDLPRLLKAGRMGYEIDHEKIPVHNDATLDSAINEGEDYELLMTFSELDKEEWAAAFPEVELTVIGTVLEETKNPLNEGGWDHFI